MGGKGRNPTAARHVLAQTGQRTIPDTLAAADRFSNLPEMIGRAGFTDRLRGPVMGQFEMLGAGRLGATVRNPRHLRSARSCR